MANPEFDYLNKQRIQAEKQGIEGNGFEMMDQSIQVLEGQMRPTRWSARNSEQYYATENVSPEAITDRKVRSMLMTMRMAELLNAIPVGATVCEFGTGQARSYVGPMWRKAGRVVAIEPIAKEAQIGIKEGRLPPTTEVMATYQPPYSLLGEGETELTLSISTTHTLPATSLYDSLRDLCTRTTPGGKFVSVVETDVSPRFFQGIDRAASERLYGALRRHRDQFEPDTFKGLIQYAASVEEELQDAPISVYQPGRQSGVITARYKDAGFGASIFDNEFLLGMSDTLAQVAELLQKNPKVPAELQSAAGIRRFLFSNTGPGLLRIMEPLKRFVMLSSAAMATDSHNMNARIIHAFSNYATEQLMQDMHMVVLTQAATEAGFRSTRMERRAIAIAAGHPDCHLFHDGITLRQDAVKQSTLVYREFTAQK